MITFRLFQFLRWLLVVLTGRGYDRSSWMNTLHHKLAHRFHRKLSWFGISGIQKIPAPGMPGKFLSVRAEDGGVAHQLLMYREYEPFESQLVRLHVTPGMTVYNIGANIGYYSLLSSECVGPNGKVYSFEPEPNNFELLKRNIEENNIPNVKLFQVAMGSKAGTAELALSTTNSGDHQLRSVEGRVSVVVPVMTVDEFSDEHYAPDAIIMDVQGSELDVLRGAENILAGGMLQIIFLEFWPQGLNERHTDGARELLQKIDQNGFSISIIDEKNRTVKPTSTNELLQTISGSNEVNLLCRR